MTVKGKSWLSRLVTMALSECGFWVPERVLIDQLVLNVYMVVW